MRELRRTEKLIITVAPTGSFQGKEANPNLPIEPDEIAEAAYDCWNEGAAIVHIHAREKGTEKPTSDPEIYREIDHKIRDRNCDIIIQHSTAGDYIPRLPPDKRIRAIEMNPEMASLSVTFTRMNFWGGENVRIVTPSEIEEGARAMRDRGIKPELEIYNLVNMHDVYGLIEKGLVTKPYWIDFIFGMHRMNQGFMPYSPRYLMWLIDLLPSDSMFSVLGVADVELQVTTLSVLLGGHLRVGFEDNVYYSKGILAESNAQMVARAVRLGRELGCEIATPDEAREMLGIPRLGA